MSLVSLSEILALTNFETWQLVLVLGISTIHTNWDDQCSEKSPPPP